MYVFKYICIDLSDVHVNTRTTMSLRLHIRLQSPLNNTSIVLILWLPSFPHIRSPLLSLFRNERLGIYATVWVVWRSQCVCLCVWVFVSVVALASGVSIYLQRDRYNKYHRMNGQRGEHLILIIFLWNQLLSIWWRMWWYISRLLSLSHFVWTSKALNKTIYYLIARKR